MNATNAIIGESGKSIKQMVWMKWLDDVQAVLNKIKLIEELIQICSCNFKWSSDTLLIQTANDWNRYSIKKHAQQMYVLIILIWSSDLDINTISN